MVSSVSDALAYFITFTTYGTWLHGRDPGSVDREHNTPGTPFRPADLALEQSRRETLRQAPYALDEERRSVVLRTILKVAKHRRWRVWAAHVRTNHVHIVVTAKQRAGSVSDGQGSSIVKRKPPKPEKVMNDFKAWASRRLREAFDEPSDRDRWTQHGSTIWLNTAESLRAAVKYVVEEQGEPMACFDGRIEDDVQGPEPYEPEAYEPEA